MPHYYLCPLCQTTQPSTFFFSDKHREYWLCAACSLVFVPTNWHLSIDQEKTIYDLHDNRADDIGYQQFLSRLARPILERAPKTHCLCLDYGCGPTPLLADLIRAQHHQVIVYDPFYAKNSNALQQNYDVITCSEVAEHFREPRIEFDRLFALLNPGGILGIMTKLVIDHPAFTRWHYKNDLTHISFFSQTTMHWIAEQYGCDIELVGNDVTLFYKNTR